YSSASSRDLLPFPTRRSSDLPEQRRADRAFRARLDVGKVFPIAPLLHQIPVADEAPGTPAELFRVRRGRVEPGLGQAVTLRRRGDRKSTRLNSSHQIISYAVF